ncbi:MAG: hypothetical protein RR448_11150 [Niameybacter sp.]
MAQKKKKKAISKTKPTKQKLDPLVKVAIINGIFAILVALITKLL